MDIERSEREVVRLAVLGTLANIGLAGIKLAAGLIGNSYALVADAIESLVDIAGSLVIWIGLRYAQRPADEEHPYGHGRAESLAALAVAGMVCLAGVGIAIKAVEEIVTPHHAPEWWTLLVLGLVVATKELLARRADRAAQRAGSSAGAADAAHHRSDAITSFAAFIGIGISVWGGPGWESADDWAALAASGIILYNGVRIARPAIHDLLDRQPQQIVRSAIALGSETTGVSCVQKAWAHRSGTRYFIDMHVWVPGTMSVREAHQVAHAVKDRIRTAMPQVRDVMVHIEPDGGTQ